MVLLGVQVSGQSVFRSSYHDYRVVNFVDALVQPWSIAFLPGGDTLITERPGRLRIVRNGKLLPNAVEGLPPVVHSSQGGLLEVAVHPNFATNRLLYITYSKQVGDPPPPGSKDPVPATTALIRARFENDRLTNVRAVVPVGVEGPRALRRQDRLRQAALCICHSAIARCRPRATSRSIPRRT